MQVQLFDLEDESNPLNGTWLGPERLGQVLQEMSLREPFGLQLRGESGYMMTLGIGRSAGFAQHSPSNGAVPYLVAVARKAGTDSEFAAGGTLSPISGRYVMPIEEVVDVALRFASTGERDDRFEWAEI